MAVLPLTDASMTSFGKLDPSLAGLFRRVDFAPRPTQQSLTNLLDIWSRSRGERLAPSLEEMQAAVREDKDSIFIYRNGPDGFHLEAGEGAVSRLIGPCKRGEALQKAKVGVEALRLSRLFSLLNQVGEPVLVQFVSQSEGEERFIDLLALPVSSDGAHIGGIVSGLSVRSRPHLAASGSSHPCFDAGSEPLIFALPGSLELGEKIALRLDTGLAPLEDRAFEDGEHKIRPLTSVRNKDVYVVNSLTGDGRQSVNDKLVQILLFIGALRQNGAKRITAVAPYLCYSRKERQTKPRDPVSTSSVARLFEAVGTDAIMTVTAHNLAAFQNAFRIRTEHLDPTAILVRHLAPHIAGESVSIVSPDVGGAKRAELFRERLEKSLGRGVAKAFVDKKRSMGVVSGKIFAGDVDGMTAVVIDDLISTGGTLLRAAEVCREHGARRIICLATHALLTTGANQLATNVIDRIMVTDTVSLGANISSELRSKLEIVSMAGLLGEAICRLHRGGSMTELQEAGDD
jgi:ribose-phosphate pyrophosphokinase